jgi:hypothetical protein
MSKDENCSDANNKVTVYKKPTLCEYTDNMQRTSSFLVTKNKRKQSTLSKEQSTGFSSNNFLGNNNNINNNINNNNNNNNESPQGKNKKLEKNKTRWYMQDKKMINSKLLKVRASKGSDELIGKTYLSDAENDFSKIIDKGMISEDRMIGGYIDRLGDEVESSSLNSSRRFIKTTRELANRFMSYQQETKDDLEVEPETVGDNEQPAFATKILEDENDVPDQVVATGIYINFKFLEFVTALFTFLSRIILI